MSGNFFSYNDDDFDSDDEVGLIDLTPEQEGRADKEKAVKEEESETHEEEELSEDELPALLDEADEIAKKGQFGEAIIKYEAAYKVEPTSYKIINNLARLYAIRGRLKKLVNISLDWMKQLEKERHFELALVVAQAVMRFDLGSLEARLGVLRCIQNSDDEEKYIQTVLDYSNYFVDIGNGELSVKVLQVALEAYPLRVELAVKLADIHMQLGNIQECTKQCQNIATFYENKNDYVHAAELYRRLRMLLPEDLGIALRLGELYSLTGAYEDSVAVYRSCMHIAYDSREVLMGLASASMHMGRFSDAGLALRKILSATPDDFEAREQLAEVYVKTDNPSEAIIELTTIARGYIGAKEYDNGVRVLERLLELDSNNTYAVRELSNIKDIIAQREARLAKMSEMAKQAKESENSSSNLPTVAVVQAASEEDLYADDGPVGGFDDEFGAPSEEANSETLNNIDDDYLPLMASSIAVDNSATLAETSPSKKPVSVTRVLVGKAVPGQLQVPVPFVMASYPDTIELMQTIISEPPSRDVLPWEYLAVLDADVEAEVEAKAKAEAEQKEKASTDNVAKKSDKKEVKAGPVASAFASSSSSMFGESVFSTATIRSAHRSSKRRRGRRSRIESDIDEVAETPRERNGGGSSVQAALMARFSKR